MMLPVGTMLHGRYRIERYLASGGFGNTYMAKDTVFNDWVAIKEFFMRRVNSRDTQSLTVSVSNPANRSHFESQLRKFRVEAVRVRKLKNDHIVRVFDLFDEFGTSYYVMDYIEGQSLGALLKQRGKPFDEADVRNFLDQVLDALAETHRHSIWHLDIKPGNLMMNADGKLLLIDFGASKLVDASGDYSTSSMIAYTRGYAPIEQIEQRIDAIGAHTDFYALGATLYNLITGLTPPERSMIDDYGDDAFQYPAATSPAMRRLIRYLMQPLRRNRPQNIKKLRQFIAANHLGPVAPADIAEPEADPIADVILVTTTPPPEPQPVLQPAPQPAPKPQPQPETQPQPQSEPQPQPVAKAAAQPEPQREPTPEMQPKPTPKPQPQPVAKAAAQPKPTPTAKQQPKRKARQKVKKKNKKLLVALAAAAAAILVVIGIVNVFSGTPNNAAEAVDTVAVKAVDSTYVQVAPASAAEPEQPVVVRQKTNSQSKNKTKVNDKVNSQTDKSTNNNNTSSQRRRPDADDAPVKSTSTKPTATERTRHVPSSLDGNTNSSNSESNTRTRHVPNL